MLPKQLVYSLDTLEKSIEVPLLVIYNLTKKSFNHIKNIERGVEIKIQHPYVPPQTKW
jgi:hypothetical protein